MSLNLRDHPDDLFEAYALEALDAYEANLVDQHLENCSRCQVLAGRALESVTRLAMAVEQAPAPPGILDRVMAEINPPAPAVNSAANNQTRWWALPRFMLPSWFTLRGLALPAAAAVVLALFGLSVALNLRLAEQVDDMAQRNSTVTAQMANALQETERLQRETSILAAQMESSGIVSLGKISDWTATLIGSYLDAFPETQPVMLEPSEEHSGHEGFLLVEDEGMKATMMISSQNPATGNTPYLVWLVRGTDWTPAGEVMVNESGQGTLNIESGQSLFEFDSVNVTMEGQEPARDQVVLTSRIPHQANPK